MKKIIFGLFILVVSISIFKGNSQKIVIPKEAIRFRIIANSNSIEDQKEKISIRKDLEPVLNTILTNANSLNETKSLIDQNMPSIKDIIAKHNVNYNINFGQNYFPQKEYKGLSYAAGYYESLVVTLGDGLGDNWWCVLFPPLCLLEAEEDKYDEYTYTTYIQELLKM